jgi:hypothetical protein
MLWSTALLVTVLPTRLWAFLHLNDLGGATPFGSKTKLMPKHLLPTPHVSSQLGGGSTRGGLLPCILGTLTPWALRETHTHGLSSRTDCICLNLAANSTYFCSETTVAMSPATRLAEAICRPWSRKATRNGTRGKQKPTPTTLFPTTLHSTPNVLPRIRQHHRRLHATFRPGRTFRLRECPPMCLRRGRQ